MKRAALLAVLCGASLAMPVHAAAATRDVPGDYPTIQAAVNAAASGDEISIAAGTYPENVMLKNGVTLQGAGMGATVIDGRASASCIYVTGAAVSTTRIQDLTVTNGKSSNGGGIRLGSENACEIRRVEVRGNIAAARGGGIYIDVESRTLIEGCLISGNKAKLGGGIYCQTSYCALSFNIIELNSASQNGGGFYGAFDCSEIVNNTFDGNASVGSGSGVAFASPVSTSFLRNIVSNNSGGYGAWSSGGQLETNCNVYWRNNLGERSGGALVASERIADPRFCDYAQRNLELDFASEAASMACSDVGYAGARPPSCGTQPLVSLGACCLASLCVSDTPESECVEAGGRWQGSESSCEAAPCTNATQAKSWGEVKALFR